MRLDGSVSTPWLMAMKKNDAALQLLHAGREVGHRSAPRILCLHENYVALGCQPADRMSSGPTAGGRLLWLLLCCSAFLCGFEWVFHVVVVSFAKTPITDTGNFIFLASSKT
jgi:hypothetical protein